MVIGYQYGGKREEADALPHAASQVFSSENRYETGSIFTDIPRGVPGTDSRSMEAPTQHFAAIADILATPSLKYTEEHIFLGLVDGVHTTGDGQKYLQGGELVGVKDDRHMMTIAGTRAGKGRSCIIPNLKKYRGSILTIDPKGELALETAKIRADMGQDVKVIDPFGETDGKLSEYEARFNPMQHMTLESMVEDAVLIADALIVPAHKDSYWDDAARTFIEGVILETFTNKDLPAKDKHLTTVRDVIYGNDRIARAFLDAPRKPIEPGDEHRRKPRDPLTPLKKRMTEGSDVPHINLSGRDFFDKSDRERASVLSSARNHLRTLMLPQIASSLTGGNLDLADLKRKPTTIYLCLPGRLMGPCGRWLRLFINMALQAMERTKVDVDLPVLFIMDEFATLGHMKQIEDAAGQIAGYGVKLWPILQDITQLQALYEKRWETFMGNAGTLQFFGNNDLTTLKWISDRLGTTTYIQKAGQADLPRGDQERGKIAVDQMSTVPLLTPNEVANFFSRADREFRQLIIRNGIPHMILQRAFHDRHEAFPKTP